MIEPPAVSRTQPITIGQNFFNNPCPSTTTVTWQTMTSYLAASQILDSEAQQAELLICLEHAGVGMLAASQR